jgi:hypothetical protein
MRFEFFGLVLETPQVTFYLWSPWRASALEHKLFEALRTLPRVQPEQGPDEIRLHITDPKTARAAVQAVSRVLKGWQEDADPGTERRSWRWLLEGDTDADGYDHQREPFCLWGFLRVSLEHGGPGEQEKAEDVDLEGFGIQVLPEKSAG